jgi:hypothetical protein
LWNRSAADIAWRLYLRFNPEDSVVRLRQLLGPDEDDYDLSLNPLHRIILGLSGVTLPQQLELDASGIDSLDWMKRTPLMWAAWRDDCQNVRTLLSKGANPNIADIEGTTALHYAASEACDKCVKALLDAGADPMSLHIHGKSPLHFAARRYKRVNSESVIKSLLQHGANIEALDYDGCTPLIGAVQENRVHGVSILIKHGANVNGINYSSWPPIKEAIFLNHCEVLETLCINKAQFRWEDIGIDDVLKAAALWGSVKVMEILAETPSERIEFDREQLNYLYFKRRPNERIFGEVMAVEAERAAFINLLAKRGMPTIYSDSSSNGSVTGEENSAKSSVGNVADVTDKDVSGIENSEESDVFEDALECLLRPVVGIGGKGRAVP